jgi:uncharacterized protein (DUF1697 family)
MLSRRDQLQAKSRAVHSASSVRRITAVFPCQVYDVQTLMTIYISMLRGINVGGHKQIRMGDLRALIEALGYRNVTTYIQSGNIVFAGAKAGARSHGGRIESAIADNYGYTVSCLVRSRAEMERVVATNPWLKRRDVDPSRLHVTFLSDAPSPSDIRNLDAVASGRDELQVQGREIFLHCPDGYGRTRYSNTFLEKKLDVTATTRNWTTVSRLLAIATEI